MHCAVFLLLLAFAAAPAGGARAQTSGSAEAGRPNVLFIAVDDLRPELDVYGATHIHSPNIDALARSGMLFHRAYVQQAVCSPSRTSLMTGLRPDASRVYDLVTHFRETVPDVVTLPQHFGRHGYRTAFWGKIYHGGLLDSLSWTDHGERLGDSLRGYVLEENRQIAAKNRGRGPAYERTDVPDNAYPDGQVADQAIGSLRRFAEGDAPFFLAVGFYKPHLPFTAPERYWALYDEADIALPDAGVPPEEAPELATTNWGELRNYHGIPKEGPVSDSLARTLIHGYYAATSFADAQVGRVLRALDRLGLAGNTIVVLWGDHGWKLGEYGDWSKHTNFELDTHAPLIVRVPGMEAGQETDALVEFVDIYPTLVDLAGLPLPPHLQGTSFAPLLDAPDRPWKPAAFSQYPRRFPSMRAPEPEDWNSLVMGYSVRTDRWRYTRWQQGPQEAPTDVRARELYDLSDGPVATVNLAGQPALPDSSGQAAPAPGRGPGYARLVDSLDAVLSAGWQAAQPLTGQPDLVPAPGRGRGKTVPDVRKTEAPAMERRFAEAALNGRLAREGFRRARWFTEAWLEHADPATGLIPRNLGDSRDVWNAKDAAADNYPFMVLAAALTDSALLAGRMQAMLETETRLTSRIDRLPDTYSFATGAFVTEEPVLADVLFGASEYVKDGLLPLTEWLGPSPWRDRMLGLIDDLWARAPVETPYGRIPSEDPELNGEMLQTLARVFWMTGDTTYLDYAVRLGDYYLLGDHHPTRDVERLRLRDHGCEIVSGLTEFYATVAAARPEKKQAYERPIHAMLRRILEVGRNEHGLFYNVINPQTGAVLDSATADTWGYTLNGYYTVYLIDGTEAYRDAVLEALVALPEHYRGYDWERGQADGYADAIEGAINLHAREPMGSVAGWIDSETRRMWAMQDSSAATPQWVGQGIVNGWHGDGNFARTSILYSLWKTKGLTAAPWRADVAVGAVQQGDTLLVHLAADSAAWSGRLRFDPPRHRTQMGLPMDWPRINQFPEWFATDPDTRYRVVDLEAGTTDVLSGAALVEGLPVDVAPDAPKRLLVVAADEMSGRQGAVRVR